MNCQLRLNWKGRIIAATSVAEASAFAQTMADRMAAEEIRTAVVAAANLAAEGIR